MLLQTPSFLTDKETLPRENNIQFDGVGDFISAGFCGIIFWRCRDLLQWLIIVFMKLTQAQQWNIMT